MDFIRKVTVIGILSLLTGAQIIFPSNHTSRENFPISIATVQAATITPKAHAEDIIQTLATAFPDDDLPTFMLMDSMPHYITAATTGTHDQANYNILYFAEDEPIAIDDKQLNDLTPIASFNKQTFDSEEEATEAVNQVLDLQGEAVDLGFGITGYLQGAAGSTYLNWQEGNWSLVVKTLNQSDDDPTQLAQAVVTYLEEVFLPAPQSVGQITLNGSTNETEMTYQSQIIIWQAGRTVYQVSHSDPMQAIKMVGSISEPTEQ